ncbi:MAG: DUF4175 family protein [Asticcacaulis sp.]|uniref:DUF4175 family protein n=1 Tax=Asticcacaulis sp. TaxID=1872648 RepID=UPI0039E2D116
MNAVLARLLTRVRQAVAAHAALTWLPVALAPALCLVLLNKPVLALAAAIVAVLLAGLGSLWRAKGFDRTWLVRELNARRPDMEDSADLLYAGEGGLNPIQQMQRARLQDRLGKAETDLRPVWTWRPIVLGWCGLAAVAVLFAVTPLLFNRPASLRAIKASGGASGAPQLVSQTLVLTPPAYTGIAARNQATLDARVPQGTRIDWRVQIAPQVAAADLVFHDGKHIALTRSGDVWTASLVLNQSTLYRIDAKGIKSGALHRLDIIADTPPQIKVITPDRSLSLVTPGQTVWPLVFEVSDDYGVASVAQLHVTLAQGEGENIKFVDRDLTIAGSGSAKQKRFATQLDLGKLGFATGNDLVAQLTVSDNRNPAPQSVRSPSLILRWPSDLGNESTGIEGLAKKTLPAYFRSERQIIIDAEALLKDKKKISAAEFLKRSDAIGVDQRILRLRYGQFLGEEAEGEKNADGTPAEHHDEASEKSSEGSFGVDNGLEALYGHVHDEAEAATLLDPETRATLKKALDEMWQSELHLRQGHPELALPHAYKALAFIKEVQQATRIYLSRVGPELPPIDDSRRMTGKRDGLVDRTTALAERPDADGAVITVWMALADPKAHPDLGALEGWMRLNENRLFDPLAVYAALDAVRQDPDCQTCRIGLRNVLWAVLSRPPAGASRQPRSDPAGNRYLDALQGGAQ